MASPFRVIRKHQKTLLAIAGVLIIFVFVVGDPLSQMIQSSGPGGGGEGRRGARDVAVRWNGGQLTNVELANLVTQRRIVNGFVRQVVIEGYNAAIESGGEPQPLRVQMISGPERPEQGVEQHVLRTRLFADAAREAGMRISDEHLVRYLQELGRGFLSVEQIRQILERIQLGGRPVPTDFMLDAIREELLARNYLAGYVFAFETVLPHERWQDWLKVNDRVVVEAAAIPAESLLVDVPEPSEDELKAFFDEYKRYEPGPDLALQLRYNLELPSPRPGFAVPRRVALQFLRAEYDRYLAQLEDQITDEEIEKFYEDNKDPHFVRADAGLLDDLGLGVESPIEDNADAGDADDVETDADANNDSEAESSDSLPAHESQPAGESSGGSAPDADEQSSSRAAPQDSVFRLAAFAQEQNDTGDENPDVSTGENGAEDDAAAETEQPKQFQPLDEVRDEIRRELASLKVNEQLNELVVKLERQLQDSYTAYFGAVIEAEGLGKEPPPPPAKLADLTPLAEEYGLEYQKTEPISLFELRSLPVGGSVLPDEGNLELWRSVFGQDWELYQLRSTIDLDANRYLVMKTSDTPRRVPTLDEVRDEVVRAWKLGQAAILALKRAENLAVRAESSGATLASLFADDRSVQVTTTDPFAFYTVGTVSPATRQVSFRLSAPEGIAAAGPEFLDTVFRLGDGEVSAVHNHDHSIAYLVRVVEHLDTPAELRQAFLSEADNWYGRQTMTSGRAQAAITVLVEETLASAEVDWQRPPDELSSDEL